MNSYSTSFLKINYIKKKIFDKPIFDKIISSIKKVFHQKNFDLLFILSIYDSIKRIILSNNCSIKSVSMKQCVTHR